ncbi:MAG: 50S ribosomal protein L15 [Alphaproteobacteria bacterium MarineAlpha6_Bin6]|nr:50S ribosomal protein L15 [Pelagibacteraceae bacterium]PPR31723.1 MAG: 50S ribosomal protein L15 [Alphaproteobacteria bacterium MarineAlpha6_Bin6]PPR32682.1 MAG: 50S ribosomal protein L15 [Alphaproteobacteria bacterium MarineAlpha6_Bin5]|tara:strand:+ start:291 stop:809 length:519 start_codon:yes stop_codon:yes gene_type:complete
MLNTLVNLKKKKISKKRLGRGIGSGKGKTSGRGHKGQKSRSGVSIKGFEGGQMPLYRRLPKRGFRNIFKKDFNIINLIQIQSFIDKKKISDKDEINVELLLKKKIIKKKLSGVKVLGKGELKSKISINVNKVTKSAIKKIEKNGGKINIIEIKKNNLKKKDKKVKEENQIKK